jgi:5'-3' exonuclease
LDTSDNISGVDGIGEKTALKLVQEFQSVSQNPHLSPFRQGMSAGTFFSLVTFAPHRGQRMKLSKISFPQLGQIIERLVVGSHDSWLFRSVVTDVHGAGALRTEPVPFMRC